MIGDPPLLRLDHIDTDLDEEGRDRLRRIVDRHPGVVVFASDVPDRVAPDHRAVDLV